jgi:hypothetical protein
LNRTANPQLSLQSLANSSPNDSIFTDIVDNTNAQSEIDIEQAQEENDQIDSLVNNSSGSSSSGSSGDVLFNTPLKRKKMNNDEDEEFNELVQSNFNNINNNPNVYSSNDSSIANIEANLNSLPV